MTPSMIPIDSTLSYLFVETKNHRIWRSDERVMIVESQKVNCCYTRVRPSEADLYEGEGWMQKIHIIVRLGEGCRAGKVNSEF